MDHVQGVLRAPLHESAEFRPTSVPAQRVFSPGVLHPTATAHAADVANGVADDGLTPGGGGHAGDDGVAGNLLSRAASVAVAAMAATAASNEDTDEVEEQERLARTTERLVLVDAQSKPESLDSFEGRLATFSLTWRGAITGRTVRFEEERLLPLTVDRLAWAGLYYLPDSRIDDRTVCYACGKALHTWAQTDDPLYEHCRLNPSCPHVQTLVDDNPQADIGGVEADIRGTSGSTTSGAATGPAAPGTEDRRYDWSGITEDWHPDTVIDHLLLVVHGIGTNDETLPAYVETLRKTFEPSWQRKYLDIPLSVAVDAISWHTMARAPQETMEKITLPSVPAVRSVINETCLDVLYYRSPHYGQRLINAVAHLLNNKVALYRQRFPKFSGHVSLFCHSLGSVIMFDLLQKQRQPGQTTETSRPTVFDGRMSGERGIGTHSDEDWVWPQLNFKVYHLFGLGSPISIFLTTRGDIYKDSWQQEATSFAFPNGARFFNIFDPCDPVAFRFEPLINAKYSRLSPAMIPSRHKRSVDSIDRPQPAQATRADFYGWQRIDYVLQEGGSQSGLLGHIRAIAQESCYRPPLAVLTAHYCYWLSKDLALFILDAILDQKLNCPDSDTNLAGDIREMDTHGLKGPRGRHSPPGSNTSPPAGGAGSDAERMRMDAEGWASEVLAIKEQVMWLLTSDLLAADVPPIVGSRAGATGGTFTYALGHLRVSSIDVPRHKVLVVCGRDGSITVKATDISAHLQGFSWLYKQKGPPHLKDSGTADASMQGISLWLGINREQLNMGVYRRKHRPCSTGINTTDTRGTAASIKPGAIHLDSAATATSPAAKGGDIEAECVLCENQPEQVEPVSAHHRDSGDASIEGLLGTSHATATGAAMPSTAARQRWQQAAAASGGTGRGDNAREGALDGGGGGDGNAGNGEAFYQAVSEAVALDAVAGAESAGGEKTWAALHPAGAQSPPSSHKGSAVDVRIKIRALDIELHKSSGNVMMSWLYRMLLSAFSERIRSSVEEAVVHTLQVCAVVLDKAMRRAGRGGREGKKRGREKQKSWRKKKLHLPGLTMEAGQERLSSASPTSPGTLVETETSPVAPYPRELGGGSMSWMQARVSVQNFEDVGDGDAGGEGAPVSPRADFVTGTTKNVAQASAYIHTPHGTAADSKPE